MQRNDDILVAIYNVHRVNLLDLPYTKTLMEIRTAFNRQTKEKLKVQSVWKALAELHIDKKLPKFGKAAMQPELFDDK